MLATGQLVGVAGAQARVEWQARLDAFPSGRRAEFDRVMAGEPPRVAPSRAKKAKKSTSESEKPSGEKPESEKPAGEKPYG